MELRGSTAHQAEAKRPAAKVLPEVAQPASAKQRKVELPLLTTYLSSLMVFMILVSQGFHSVAGQVRSTKFLKCW